jgi:uncharacterized protein with LGFP repeats
MTISQEQQQFLEAKYQAVGGATGPRGSKVGNLIEELVGTKQRAVMKRTGGEIWCPEGATDGSQACEIYGRILAFYRGLTPTIQLALGTLISDEVGLPDGEAHASYFAGGAIFWTLTTGAFAVYGAIYGRYQSSGGYQVFGMPLASEEPTSAGGGRQSRFVKGHIIWRNTLGATALRGPILQRWLALGGAGSSFGLPTGSQVGAATEAWKSFARFEHGYIAERADGTIVEAS